MPELRRRSAGATQSYRGSHWNPPAETFDRLGIPWRLGEAQRRYNKRLTTQVPWRATFDTGRRRISTDLAFIETALAKDLRKYFCTDFYKDHLQTYKKRPIYWPLQSPAGPSRGGFACLIYLHRYTKDTLNQVLNNYCRPYLQKLEARQAQLGLDQLNDALPSRARTAARKEA